MPAKAGPRLLKTRLIRHVKGSWAAAKTDTPPPPFSLPSELAVHLLDGVWTQMALQPSCRVFFSSRAQTNAVDILESGVRSFSVNHAPVFTPSHPHSSPCPRGSSDFSSTLSGCFKKRRLGQRARPRRRVNFVAAAADRLCTCSSPTERVKCLLVLITAWQNTTSHPLPGRRVSRLI